MKLNIGDTVQLKSGGPVMTVASLATRNTVDVVWFNEFNAPNKIEKIHHDALKSVSV